MLGLASALLWSLANLAIQPASRRFGTFGALALAQALGVLLAVLAAWPLEGGPAWPDTVTWSWIFGAALAAVLAYGGLFDALRRGRLSVCAPIISAWSALTVVVALVFYAERPGRVGLVGVVMVLLGNVLLGRSSARDGANRGEDGAIVSALLSAVGFGLFVPALREVGARTGELWAVAWVWGLELVIALPILWRLGFLPRWPRGRDWRLVGLSGGLEVAGCIALSLAANLAPMSEVAPASSLTTAFSVSWGLLILRERLRPIAIAGAIAASVGVLLVNAG
ncbi:MAG: DMT family transporter [Planctomycetes bacterium]|nr:DMT family transporter [Planctomycetota bacterium]